MYAMQRSDGLVDVVVQTVTYTITAYQYFHLRKYGYLTLDTGVIRI